MSEPLAYTVREVAQVLRIGRNRVYDLVATGELPALRIGRAIRIPAGPLNDWIHRNTESSR